MPGRSIAEKLKEVIPRQMFEVPIQAAIGGKDHLPGNRQPCLGSFLRPKCFMAAISPEEKAAGRKSRRKRKEADAPGGERRGALRSLL